MPEHVEYNNGLLFFYQLDAQIPYFNMLITSLYMNVGPCHHGIVRPLVADGGTASNMEGSCE